MAESLIPLLGPAFLVFVGYMDPGKWATALEGGSRFGFELVWVMVFSNVLAILLQRLSSQLGLVTRKNLAQVCNAEYPQALCFLLWLQCEFSVVVLDLTMVLGIATGLNFLVGLPMVPCIFLTTIDALLFLVCLPHLGMHRAKIFTASIVGIVLICFVLDALHSNTETSAVILGMLPRLKAESLYTAASIFGANVLPYNFYLHSALFQGKNKVHSSSMGAMFHYNSMDILLASGAAFMVNMAVLSSATITFYNSGYFVITLQDAQALMEKMLSNSVAPAAFGLALLCGGQLSTLTGIIAGQVAMEGFFGLSVPVSLHRLLIKAAAVLPAVFFVSKYGSEGTYQILIFSQVILALQLPFTVVPLIKVTSSRAVMGQDKNSSLFEGLAWFYVALMFFMNIWLVFDMLFGESDEWIGSGSWNFARDFRHSSAKWGKVMQLVVLTFTVLVTVLSTCLLMWMISTPLRGDRNKLESSLFLEERVPPVLTLHDSKAKEFRVDETSIIKSDQEGQSRSYRPQINELLTEADLKTSKEHGLNDEPQTNMEDNPENTLSLTQVSTQLIEHPEDVKQSQSQTSLSVEDLSFVDSVSSVNLSSLGSSPLMVSPPASLAGSPCVSSMAQVEKCLTDNAEAIAPREPEADADADFLDKDDYEVDGWENLEQEDFVPDSMSCIGGSTNSLTFEEPESGRSIGGRSDVSEGSGGGSGSGSLSRLSGLGRAARRQYAGVLDEFWGKLFDLHGQPISQTSMKWQEGFTTVKIAPIDMTHQGSTSKLYDKDIMQTSPKLSKKLWHKDLSGDQSGLIDMYLRAESHGAASTSSHFGHSYSQNSFAYDASERRYSSLRFPVHHEEYDEQPSTVHGYKSASYAGRSGNFALGTKGSKPMHLDTRHHAMHSSSRSYDQPFDTGFNYKLPRMMVLGDTHSDQKLYNNSAQSLLMSQRTDESLVRSLDKAPMTDRLSSQIERHLGSLEPSSYGNCSDRKSQWDPFEGTETGTWHPLVYRATGELDLGHNHPSVSQKAGTTINTTFTQLPIGRGGRNGQRGNNDERFRLGCERAPLSFDEISPSQLRKDGFSIQSSSTIENQSLWSRQPFEQLFGSPDMTVDPAIQRSGRDSMRTNRTLQRGCSGIEWEVKVLKNLRSCVAKLLRLDGSDWLFRIDSGSDEDLIAAVAMREKILLDAETCESQRLYNTRNLHCTMNNQSSGAVTRTVKDSGSSASVSGAPHCGEGCVWGIELLVSFGVWCIHRILELSLMESRPELWGKYTYVLNRLQGILEPAFSNPRSVPPPCICVQWQIPDSFGVCSQKGAVKDTGNVDILSGSLSNAISTNSFQGHPHSWPWGRNTSFVKGKGASATIFIDIIKDVETAVGARKGRSGTAAGDVAFPKGKENLASVLKRYKRRLGNMLTGSPASVGVSSGSRQVPGLTSAVLS